MRTIIQNGTIVSDTAAFRADLLLEDGVVKAVGAGLSAPDAQVIDASGKYVLPGAVDVHTHMDLQAGAHRAVDDFYTGTVAAACGGTTTIVDHMAFGPKGCSLWHQVEEYHRLADGKAVIDYGFHGVLQHVDERVLREMGELADREGITSFKAYLTYDFGLDDGALFQVLRQAREDGIVIPAHCENDGVVNYLRGWYKAQGLTQPIYHARSRPARCEAEAVSRLLHLAAMAGEAPVYVVHLSSAAGLAEVRKARAQRQKGVGVETCTQYLTLTEASYADPQEGLKAVMSPPLRTQADCDALWQGLQDGVIDAVATDHCPFHFAVEKQFGAGDFTACPNGAPGVEERLPVLYSEGVAKGRLSICELVRLLCANPSRLYGLYPGRAPSSPAPTPTWSSSTRPSAAPSPTPGCTRRWITPAMRVWSSRGPLTWCSPAEKWWPGTTSSWASGALDATSSGAIAAWPNKYKTSAASKAGGALARMRGAEKPPALRAGGLGRASAVPLLDEGAELVGEPAQILVGAALVVGDDLHEPAAHILQALVGRRAAGGGLGLLLRRQAGGEHLVIQQVVDLFVVWGVGGQSLFPEGVGVDLRHLLVAVDHEHLPGPGAEVLDPPQQAVPVGVGGEAMEVDDPRPHGDLLAEELDRADAVEEPSAQAALGLIAHEHHGALRPPEVVLEVVANTASVAHTGGGDDHLRVGSRLRARDSSLLSVMVRPGNWNRAPPLRAAMASSSR